MNEISFSKGNLLAMDPKCPYCFMQTWMTPARLSQLNCKNKSYLLWVTANVLKFSFTYHCCYSGLLLLELLPIILIIACLSLRVKFMLLHYFIFHSLGHPRLLEFTLLRLFIHNITQMTSNARLTFANLMSFLYREVNFNKNYSDRGCGVSRRFQLWCSGLGRTLCSLVSG